MKVKCENCQKLVDSRGLSSHQRGGPCDVLGRQLKLKAQGRGTIPKSTGRALAEYPTLHTLFDPQFHATHFYPGGIGRSSYYSDEAWIQDPEFFHNFRTVVYELKKMEEFAKTYAGNTDQLKKHVEAITLLRNLEQERNG